MRTLKPLIFLSILATIPGCSLPSRLVTVTTGKRIVCSECGRLISYQLVISQVPYAKVNPAEPKEIKEICPTCQIKKAEAQIHQEIAGIVGSWYTSSVPATLTFKEDGTGVYQESDGEEKPFSWHRGILMEFTDDLPMAGRLTDDGNNFDLFVPKNHGYFLLERLPEEKEPNP